MAPIVRLADGERELLQMRWGFPPPPKVGNHPVTNVRNVSSPFWRAWLKPQYRCLVPLTSFSEYADTKPRKTPIWFALNKDAISCHAALGPYLTQRSATSNRSRRQLFQFFAKWSLHKFLDFGDSHAQGGISRIPFVFSCSPKNASWRPRRAFARERVPQRSEGVPTEEGEPVTDDMSWPIDISKSADCHELPCYGRHGQGGEVGIVALRADAKPRLRQKQYLPDGGLLCRRKQTSRSSCRLPQPEGDHLTPSSPRPSRTHRPSIKEMQMRIRPRGRYRIIERSKHGLTSLQNITTSGVDKCPLNQPTWKFE
jgi:hypothetical protein